ncbi:universal stress protein [Flavobacterium sp.]|jgi:nucleotide-binding universal stress UspA family protein|uniref:universal stress protein n=1 Tax=Flavobacterium sp. TaxID=239 RepID=UPI0037BEACC0
MKTQKKVLIALDYNTNASTIADIAYSFAKAMDAEITLIHVVENEVYYTSFITSPITGIGDFDSATFYQFMNNENLISAANYYLEKIKKHLKDTKINTIIETGNFAEVILKSAKDLNVDLIIMGSHSQKWLEQVLIGSTTKEVLNQTKIPLLIIPTKRKK